MANLPFVVVGLLFLMGLIAIIAENNLFKIAIGVGVMESAANMFLVVLGYRLKGDIPVKFLPGPVDVYVLPTPQALTLTAIVIALATSALMLSLIVMLYRHYGTLDVREIRRLRG
ncbi:NADH-ubiquinone oxidoreductase chain 4L [Dethiosulfovibrio peptidovorans DSM 11002]|uniref:NADH-ubiquinone oxidoreductase chain 4L n=3 Tax=Dethiosulfovibrio TaxID=47054 RepID=D2Z4W0_9BACT|nr:NADH-ubiquinone oxidoreductase chain 4L [Dethiosulfovibrio peptidovorans DSM 11002]